MGYPTYGVKAFTHLADSKLFVGENSAIPLGYEFINDDYNVPRVPGLFMFNPKTGGKVAFEKVDERFDADGDLMFEVLAPTVQSVKKYPQVEGYLIHLFND